MRFPDGSDPRYDDPEFSDPQYMDEPYPPGDQRVDYAPLIRTCFDDDGAWSRLVDASARGYRYPRGGEAFWANVAFVSSEKYNRMKPSDIVEKTGFRSRLIFVADEVTFGGHGFRLLVLHRDLQVPLRVLPSSLWNIESSIAVGKGPIDRFVDQADPKDLTYRGGPS